MILATNAGAAEAMMKAVATPEQVCCRGRRRCSEPWAKIRTASSRWRNTRVIASNPFGPGPDSNGRATYGLKVCQGREWRGMIGARHFCIFDVKDDVMQMTVQSCGWPGDVLDKKTFKARGL